MFPVFYVDGKAQGTHALDEKCMPYRVMRRLDVSILFKIYCWLKGGTRLDGAERPFSRFYYSRWLNEEAEPDVREALERLKAKASDTGVLFNLSEAGVKFITCDLARLKRYFQTSIEHMRRHDSLLPALDENRNECASLIRFSKQIELFTKYLVDRYEAHGETFSIIRLNFKDELGKPYQQFCFEELLYAFQSDETLDIQDFDQKPRHDTDTGQAFLSPLVVVTLHPKKVVGLFTSNLVTKEVIFNNSIHWRLDSKKKQEVALAAILTRLIAEHYLPHDEMENAEERYVATAVLEEVVMKTAGVGQFGRNIPAAIKKLPADVRREIISDRRRGSRGYAIRASS